MLKTRIYVLLSAWMVIVTAVQSVHAQGFAAESWEFSISEGMSSYTDKSFQIAEPQSSPPLDHQLGVSRSSRHEGRLNFFTTPRFGTEAFYSYQSADTLFDRFTEPADRLVIPTQIHHLGVNFLYYPVGNASSTWRPFVNAGVGAMIFRPTGEGQARAQDPIQGGLPTFIESSRASFNFGAGVKRSLNRTFGVRFDVGMALAAAPTFGLPAKSEDPFEAVLPVTGRMGNPHASIGIILYLGR